jgi:putative two-component system hydrogenase maturation factor HypX/HoxX
VRAGDEQRKPLDAYRAEELAEMSRDIFDDRHGFSAARHAFVSKRKPDVTPPRLARHRPVPASPPGDVALFAS